MSLESWKKHISRFDDKWRDPDFHRLNPYAAYCLGEIAAYISIAEFGNPKIRPFFLEALEIRDERGRRIRAKGRFDEVIGEMWYRANHTNLQEKNKQGELFDENN